MARKTKRTTINQRTPMSWLTGVDPDYQRTIRAMLRAEKQKRMPKSAKQARRKVKRNPMTPRKAHAYMIVGEGANGRRYYYSGTGFGFKDDVVATYKTEAAARKVVKTFEDRLPPQIEFVYLEDA